MGSLALTGPRASLHQENMLRNLWSFLSKCFEVTVGHSEKVTYCRKVGRTFNF